MKKVLTIAGSDCSGGAGIQADLKTFITNKTYGMSVITALTAQNTTGVYGIFDITPEFVEKQIDCIFTDIIPDAVKIGMVSNSEIIKIIVKKIKEYNIENIVIDPVIVSTSGSNLLSEEALDIMVNDLLPLGKLITPNIPEAEVLSGIKITNEIDMIKAAEKISEMGINKNILIKGGHLIEGANDLLYKDGEIIWFKGERIDNINTHGTGCTLSSAIACNLAKDRNVEDSIRESKKYISDALKEKMDLGKGKGPLDHSFIIKIK